MKHNITVLTETLRKSLILRSETQTVLSDRGMIVPSRLWRIGRTNDAKLFQQELKGEISDFVVDVLIDASGSQMKRQGDVALQAYIISEALSNVDIPHRVMSFCTFWDYTIMHRFRRYDDPRSENDNIFNYVTSSNNRDGLAIRTAGYDLLQREEEKKIMIILSDGRPYDVIINRPNAKNRSLIRERLQSRIQQQKCGVCVILMSVFWGYSQERRKISQRKKRYLVRILLTSVILRTFRKLSADI